jgi:hypothetical protein
MNKFYRKREEKKLQQKRFIEKFVEELRNGGLDVANNPIQFLRSPTEDQIKNLITKVANG